MRDYYTNKTAYMCSIIKYCLKTYYKIITKKKKYNVVAGFKVYVLTIDPSI